MIFWSVVAEAKPFHFMRDIDDFQRKQTIGYRKKPAGRVARVHDQYNQSWDSPHFGNTSPTRERRIPRIKLLALSFHARRKLLELKIPTRSASEVRQIPRLRFGLGLTASKDTASRLVVRKMEAGKWRQENFGFHFPALIFLQIFHFHDARTSLARQEIAPRSVSPTVSKQKVAEGRMREGNCIFPSPQPSPQGEGAT